MSNKATQATSRTERTLHYLRQHPGRSVSTKELANAMQCGTKDMSGTLVNLWYRGAVERTGPGCWRVSDKRNQMLADAFIRTRAGGDIYETMRSNTTR